MSRSPLVKKEMSSWLLAVKGKIATRLGPADRATPAVSVILITASKAITGHNTRLRFIKNTPPTSIPPNRAGLWHGLPSCNTA